MVNVKGSFGKIWEKVLLIPLKLLSSFQYLQTTKNNKYSLQGQQKIKIILKFLSIKQKFPYKFIKKTPKKKKVVRVWLSDFLFLLRIFLSFKGH
jgi:hypothetical protein